MKRYILLVAFAIVWINPIYSQFSKYHLMKDASAVLSPRSTDYHRRLDSESVHLFRKPFVNIRYVKYKSQGPALLFSAAAGCRQDKIGRYVGL